MPKKLKHECPKPKKGHYVWPCPVCDPRYYAPHETRRWYLLHVVGDVEPELKGPYLTEFGMEKAARRLKEKVGDTDGIFWLFQEGSRVDTGAFPGGFFEKEDTDA